MIFQLAEQGRKLKLKLSKFSLCSTFPPDWERERREERRLDERRGERESEHAPPPQAYTTKFVQANGIY